MALSLLKSHSPLGGFTVCKPVLVDNHRPSREHSTGGRSRNYMMVSGVSRILL